MKKRLEAMNLRKRLRMGYTFVIVMMVVSGIFSIVGTGVLYREFTGYINNAQKADTAIKECRINMNIAARNIREMALNEDESSYPDYKATVEEKLEEIDVSLKSLKNADVLTNELYNTYEKNINEWKIIGKEIMTEIEEGRLEEARKGILEECAPALQEAVGISKEIDKMTDERKQESIITAKVSTVAAVGVVVLLVIIAAVVSSKLAKIVVWSILTPLGEVEKTAEELSCGNLHANLEYYSDDELGNLAESLRGSIHTLSSYVDDISRAMREFSNGNFALEPEVEWKGDFIGIMESLMNFQESMSETIRGLQDVGVQVKNGSDQVAASSMDLAEGATEQAGVTEELAATIATISQHVAENAENAKEISKKVENVGVEIVNSNSKMQEMVSSMSEINETSAEISKIIATINDIASQTNLLALNASIEAARAGEAGKGFAVVADQVSVLAAQSAEAAKESTGLIESSVRAVQKGMVIADETAQQLENVVVGSKIITDEVTEVAVALESQKDSIVQITQGVEQINDVVQTNSATSEECAAASQEMSSQADTLHDLIHKFKIAE